MCVALTTRINAGTAAAGESWASRITQGANHTAAEEARKVAWMMSSSSPSEAAMYSTTVMKAPALQAATAYTVTRRISHGSGTRSHGRPRVDRHIRKPVRRMPANWRQGTSLRRHTGSTGWSSSSGTATSYLLGMDATAGAEVPDFRHAMIIPWL